MKEKTRLLLLPISRKLMGVTIAYLTGIWSCAVFALDPLPAGGICAFLLMAGALSLCRRRSAFFLFLLCALITGNLFCGLQLSAKDMPTKPNTAIGGTVERIERDYRVLLGDVSLPDGQATNRSVVVTLMTQENSPLPDMPEIGLRVSGVGRLFTPDEIRNPGGIDDRLRAICDGYELSGYLLPGWNAEGEERFSLAEWFRQLRAALVKQAGQLFGENAALFAAVMLGERSEIDAEITAAMRLTGTAHILSVSGMHLSMVSAALYWLLSRLPIGRRAARWIQTAALLFFTGLTGCAVGTVRALIMTLMRMYARANGLRYDRLTALSFAALVITLHQPLMAFDGGFQFSFFVVLGIMLLEKTMSSLRPLRLLLRRARPLGEMLVISLSAQIASIPMQLSLYGYVPLLSLPMNLLCGLLMPFVMTGGWCVLLLGLLWQEAAVVCAGILSLAARAFEAVSLYVAGLRLSILRLPAPDRVLLAVFGCAMMLESRLIRFGSLRKPALVLSVLLLGGAYLLRFDPSVRYVQLDVGQGDASLIRSGRHAVVVDVGPSDSYDLIRYLRHEGLFVDAVVLSHLDEDHAGALRLLLSSEIAVGRVVMAEGAQDSVASIDVIEGLDLLEEKGIETKYVKAGDLVDAGGARMIVLSPDETLSGSNERSLLLYALAGERTLLLTGDLPIDSEPEIVPDCDVLKVAHHGSKNATSQAFLTMAKPELAIISAGVNNSYGHPHARVLEALEGENTQILRTDQSGCITVRLEGESMEIAAMKGKGL